MKSSKTTGRFCCMRQLSVSETSKDISAFPWLFPRILKHVCNRKQMHYLDILHRPESIWIQFQKHSPENILMTFYTKILFFILLGSFSLAQILSDVPSSRRQRFLRRGSPATQRGSDGETASQQQAVSNLMQLADLAVSW